jgi:hypothetical protein
MKNQKIKRKIEATYKKIREGQSPREIGKGGKYLGNGKGYIRNGGLRMYYEEFDSHVDIIGIAAKNTNIAQVLTLLKDIYNLDIDIHD